MPISERCTDMRTRMTILLGIAASSLGLTLMLGGVSLAQTTPAPEVSVETQKPADRFSPFAVRKVKAAYTWDVTDYSWNGRKAGKKDRLQSEGAEFACRNAMAAIARKELQ